MHRLHNWANRSRQFRNERVRHVRPAAARGSIEVTLLIWSDLVKRCFNSAAAGDRGAGAEAESARFLESMDVGPGITQAVPRLSEETAADVASVPGRTISA